MSVPSPVNQGLLNQRLGALGSAGSWAPNVLPELEGFIRTADDYDLFRINPIQYGGLVNLSEADAIDAINDVALDDAVRARRSTRSIHARESCRRPAGNRRK